MRAPVESRGTVLLGYMRARGTAVEDLKLRNAMRKLGTGTARRAGLVPLAVTLHTSSDAQSGKLAEK